MASVISDDIEEFILSIFGEDESVQLSRNELANYFAVSPSQINYVLDTRFNIDKGYVKESKRGGGGFITLVRIPFSKENTLSQLIVNIKEMRVLSFNKAKTVVERLLREGIVTNNEAKIIISAIKDSALKGSMDVDLVRKNVFEEILIGLMRR